MYLCIYIVCTSISFHGGRGGSVVPVQHKAKHSLLLNSRASTTVKNASTLQNTCLFSRFFKPTFKLFFRFAPGCDEAHGSKEGPACKDAHGSKEDPGCKDAHGSKEDPGCEDAHGSEEDSGNEDAHGSKEGPGCEDIHGSKEGAGCEDAHGSKESPGCEDIHSSKERGRWL